MKSIMHEYDQIYSKTGISMIVIKIFPPAVRKSNKDLTSLCDHYEDVFAVTFLPQLKCSVSNIYYLAILYIKR